MRIIMCPYFYVLEAFGVHRRLVIEKVWLLLWYPHETYGEIQPSLPLQTKANSFPLNPDMRAMFFLAMNAQALDASSNIKPFEVLRKPRFAVWSMLWQVHSFRQVVIIMGHFEVYHIVYGKPDVLGLGFSAEFLVFHAKYIWRKDTKTSRQ